jgi:hypothetical protein
MTEFREALRAAIRDLANDAGPAYHLETAYSSEDRRLVDTENVLLYNIGSASFARPSSIRFWRDYDLPDDNPGSAFTHHCSYATAGLSRTPPWTSGPPVCRWDFGLDRGSAVASVAQVWLAASRSAMTTTGFLPGQVPFAIDVTITGPAAGTRSLPGAMKTVLDGLISACHRHDSADLDELVRRLAVKTNASRAELQSRLANRSPSPLGAVRLLHRFGDGVQWHPADDRCVLATLRLVTGPFWRLSGSISPVTT